MRNDINKDQIKNLIIENSTGKGINGICDFIEQEFDISEIETIYNERIFHIRNSNFIISIKENVYIGEEYFINVFSKKYL